MWREEAGANRRRGADVLVKEAYPIECVRPPQAPVTGGRQASKSRVVLECSPKTGGKLHPRLNTQHETDSLQVP